MSRTAYPNRPGAVAQLSDAERLTPGPYLVNWLSHSTKEEMAMAHDGPASFHASPAEAQRAPAEELLYLACLHEGTGVEKPDFLAVIDAEEGRIVHETPMPNVGDELHHYGWNRCSSACHGPDRSHLIVPGFRSSRIHLLDVATDPGGRGSST